MKQLIINNFIIDINLKPLISPKGRHMRLSGTAKNLDYPEKWIDNVIKYHWIYTYIFLDKEGGFIDFKIDYNDKYYK